MIPSKIQKYIRSLVIPTSFLWAAFYLSTGVFSIACSFIGVRRGRIFFHEWTGMIIILVSGALLGFTPEEEFLVLLPLAVSLILIITRLGYPLLWDGAYLNGVEFEVHKKSGIRGQG